jgi:hypothetical protein
MLRAKFSVVFAALAAVLSMANLGRADIVTATLTGLDPYAGATIYVGGNSVGGGGVGLLEWNGTGFGNSSSPIDYNGFFNTFCIDVNPSDFIYFDHTYTFTTFPLPPTLSATGGTPALSSNQVNALEALFGTYLGSLSGEDAYQGFQLSIWSIVYNYGGTSVGTPNSGFYIDPATNGGFSGEVSTNAINDANGWLTNIYSIINAGSPYTGLTFDHALTFMQAIGQGQNQLITAGPTFTTTSVPAPSAALGGMVLLAGLGLARFGRRLAAI